MTLFDDDNFDLAARCPADHLSTNEQVFIDNSDPMVNVVGREILKSDDPEGDSIETISFVP